MRVARFHRGVLAAVGLLLAAAGCATVVSTAEASSNPIRLPAPTASTVAPSPAAATSTVAPATSSTVAPTTSTTVAPHWVEYQYRLAYGGQNRTYIVVRPSVAYAKPLAVVVMLAGCCRSASVEVTRADFAQVAWPAILVYPEYLNGYWNAGACCGSSAANGVDDVGFVTHVVDAVRASFADASQAPAYLAGYSNGAKLAMEIACEDPSTFAAVAVFGGTRTTTCPTEPAESVFVLAGSTDPYVSIAGPAVVEAGFSEPTVYAIVQSYLDADGCSGTPVKTTAGVLQTQTWTTCTGGRRVSMGIYEGMSHGWPEPSGATPSGQAAMWQFFTSLGA